MVREREERGKRKKKTPRKQKKITKTCSPSHLFHLSFFPPSLFPLPPPPPPTPKKQKNKNPKPTQRGYYCSTAVQTGPKQNCVYYNAVSNTPGGPFKIATANASIDGTSNADDFDLFVEEDGKGYIVYDQNLASLRVAPLTPDFLKFDVSVEPSVLVDGNYEAPAVFKRNGVFYFTYGWIVCFGKR